MALLHSFQVATEQRPVHIQVVVLSSCNTLDSAYFIPRQAVNNFCLCHIVYHKLPNTFQMYYVNKHLLG